MPTDGPAIPHPKAAATTPGRKRRYRRFTAGPKQWQALHATKDAPCRVCGGSDSNGHVVPPELHHIVPRSAPWFGDDYADNLAPLCRRDHDLVTRRDPIACRILLATLTDTEYSYAVQRGGEGFFERAYGIEFSR